MKKTPLEYGIYACNALMNKYEPEELPPKGTLFYHQGVFLSGMKEIYTLTKDKQYLEYVKKYMDNVIGPNGEVYGFCHEITTTDMPKFAKESLTMLDCKQPCILCYWLYDETGEEKYHKVIETVAESMYYWPVNQYGGYWHMMTQPFQMWMDGAYMIGPFCVEYAERFGDDILRERAIKQVFLMDEFMRDPVTGLYYHGFDDSRQERWADPNTGLSGQFWGRAVGWYTVAILDILEHLPQEHPSRERLRQIEYRLLNNLRKYQDSENGMWYQILDKPNEPDNWVETSCTCLFMYSYAKAYRMGIMGEEVHEILRKAYDGLEEKLYFDEQGNLVISEVCVGTCIEEGTYDFYIQRPKTENDLHGVGAFLLMCAELERYRNEKV